MISYDDIFDVVEIGAIELDATNNVLSARAKSLGGEEYAALPIYGSPGIISAPYPPDDNGSVQGLVLSTPNSETIIGQRDIRIADVYGDLSPGDTVVCSTGPEHAARIFCKEESGEVTLMSKDPDGDDCYITINGTEEVFQATVAGFGLELGADDGFKAMTSGGYIQIEPAGKVVINGSQVLLGNTQLGNMLVLPAATLALWNAQMLAVDVALRAMKSLTGPLSSLATIATTYDSAVTPPPTVLAATNVFG